MDVVKVNIACWEASDALRKYKKDLHYSSPVDEEIQYALRALARGKVVLQAIASIEQAGLGPDGLPKLAIARADQEKVIFNRTNNRWCFEGPAAYRKSFNLKRHDSNRVACSAVAFPELRGGIRGEALLPRIPLTIKPKRGLENYYVLWEAEWQPRPPKDPYLLRRIGKGDLWLVCAHWDLTPVELAALSCRVGAA